MGTWYRYLLDFLWFWRCHSWFFWAGRVLWFFLFQLRRIDRSVQFVLQRIVVLFLSVWFRLWFFWLWPDCRLRIRASFLWKFMSYSALNCRQIEGTAPLLATGVFLWPWFLICWTWWATCFCWVLWLVFRSNWLWSILTLHYYFWLGNRFLICYHIYTLLEIQDYRRWFYSSWVDSIYLVILAWRLIKFVIFFTVLFLIGFVCTFRGYIRWLAFLFWIRAADRCFFR